jgi:hypothetical protein
MWDTGMTVWGGAAWTNATITYGGAPLLADTSYTWQATSWLKSLDGTVAPTAPSAPASFHIGLLTTADWGGAISISASPAAPPPAPPPTPAKSMCKADCKMLEVGAASYYSGSVCFSLAPPFLLLSCACTRNRPVGCQLGY